LEHVVFTFFISGVSRSLTHELVRQRVGVAYSQLSQRYVEERAADFIVPDIIRHNPDTYGRWAGVVKAAHFGYIDIVDQLTADLTDPAWAARWLPHGHTATDRRKAARQAARSVLPNATETKLGFTANARALRHLFDTRGKFAAEPEIRKLAHSLWAIVVQDSPNLFGDYKVSPLPDGTVELVTDHPGV
jgi:thymidylate synthase (FAD)